MDNAAPKRDYDKFAEAFKAFNHYDFSENDYYLLELTAHLFEIEQDYELKMDILQEACVTVYGETQGRALYGRLMNS